MSIHAATVPADADPALSGDATRAGRESPNRALYAIGPAPDAELSLDELAAWIRAWLPNAKRLDTS